MGYNLSMNTKSPMIKLFLFLILFSSLFAHTEVERKYLENKKTLSVCVKKNWLPYEDVKGVNFIGISADFMKIITDSLDMKLEIIEAKDRKELLEFLLQKRCDVRPLISQYISKTIPYRASIPYIQERLALSTRMDQSFISGLELFLDEEFVVLKGQKGFIDFIKKKHKGIKLIEVDTTRSALEMVENKEAFAYLGMTSNSAFHIQNGFSTTVKIINTFEDFKISIGVVNDDRILQGILDEVILEIPMSKKREILNKWISTKVEQKVEYKFLWELLGFFTALLGLVLFFLMREHRLKLEIEAKKVSFQNLYDKTTDGVVLMKEGKFIDCNESILKMFKFSTKETYLTAHIKSHSPRYQPNGKESWKESIRLVHLAMKRGSYKFEWLHQDADGDQFWVESVLTKIDVNHEDILHLALRDITRKKELEDEILKINSDLEIRVEQEIEKNRQKEKQLFAQSRLAQMGEMISMIAHQWRQPLSAIATASINMKMSIVLNDFNLEENKNNEACMTHFDNELNNIETYVQSLTQTIDDFRNFYRPDKQSIKVALTQPLEKALMLMKNSFDKAHVEIELLLDSKKIIPMYDSEMMQVMLNILKNAVDHFNQENIESPKLKLTSLDTDTSVILKIEDNGGGIAQGVVEKIFDPYFSTKDEKNGTGLGLYMSKVIVEEHHKGSIVVTNTKAGACFKIEIRG